MTGNRLADSPPTPSPAPIRRAPTLLLVTAVALALLSLWLALLHYLGREENATLRSQLALADAMYRSAQNQTEAERLIAARQLRNRGELARCQVTMLTPLPGLTAPALGVAVWDPAAQEGILVMDRLPPAAVGKVYQLWIVDPQAGAVDAGSFAVDPGTGLVRHPFKGARLVGKVSGYVVSLEPAGGSPKPLGPQLLGGQ